MDMSPPQQVDAETMLVVTMQAQQWQMIVEVLHDARYRIAKPLIDMIVAQCTGGSQHPQMASKLNGGEAVAEPMPRARG